MKRLFLSFKFRNILFIKIWKNSKKIISFFFGSILSFKAYIHITETPRGCYLL